MLIILICEIKHDLFKLYTIRIIIIGNYLEYLKNLTEYKGIEAQYIH